MGYHHRKLSPADSRETKSIRNAKVKWIGFTFIYLLSQNTH